MTVLRNITNDYFNTCHSGNKKSQYFLDRFSTFQGCVPGQYTYMIGTHKVCGRAFCSAYQLPSSTFFSYLKLHRDGVRSFSHGLKGTEKWDSAKTVILPFIDTFIAENGNFMPDEADKVYLPPGMTMETLFEEYIKLRPDYRVSAKYFSRVYYESFKNVAINVSTNISKIDFVKLFAHFSNRALLLLYARAGLR